MKRLLLSLALGFIPGLLIAEDHFTVLPELISLTGPKSYANVLVQRVNSSKLVGSEVVADQIVNDFDLRVSDPGIADIRGTQVHALSDGSTELVVSWRHSSRVARIPITVRSTLEQKRWQFVPHVQSVLSRRGCNSGACHGALAGKGGFRLSLAGFDPQADLSSMVNQNQGRRIEPAQPLESLLLTKPSMQVPHKGGARLPEDSPDFRLIAEWIANGASGPDPGDADLRGIEVLPKAFQAVLGNLQSLIVRAHYEDGRVEDVTHWAKFSSSNEAVAEVDEHGKVRVVGQGRGAIVAWFSGRIALSSIDVPYHSNDDGTAIQTDGSKLTAEFRTQNFIDEILATEWASLGLAPSPACDDLTFLRRASLDSTGSLPDTQAVQELIESGRLLDRKKLIGELLNSTRFVDYWTYQWSDLLLLNGNLLRPKAVESFYKWIRLQVENNVPWNEFARSIVLAQGDSLTNGATNFYAIHQTPEAMTENVCLAFMGLSIECAKCHNHPLERWTNDQYYAMANLFARVRAKGWGGDPRNGDGDRTLLVLERGELIQPIRGVPQPPRPLDQPPLDPSDTRDRREYMADWLASPNNAYFSRAIVNRIWANFMGVGLVEPVDDLRASNPACSERLMESLSGYLVDNDYDLKSLMQLIMSSQVYQLASQAQTGNQSDQRFYCRYYPRRLPAEVLHDAMVKVTNVPTQFDKIEFVGADNQPTEFYPLGTSALELYDSAVSSYFLKTFGRHQRRITCECERSDEPTVIQALHLNNGDTLNSKLSHPDSILSKWLTDSFSMETMIEKAFTRTLCRPPGEIERKKILTEWESASASGVPMKEFVEDLLWSLMCSREFLFNY